VVEFPPDPSGKIIKQRINGRAPKDNNTKTAAEEAMREHINLVLSSNRSLDVIAPNNRKEIPTFRTFVSRFFEYTEARNKHSELVNKKSILERHLIPYFADFRLDQIRSIHIEEYKQAKLKSGRVFPEPGVKTGKSKQTGLSKKTIDNHLILLRRILNVAREWEIIERTPKHELYRPKDTGFDFLNFEEAERLIDAAKLVPARLSLDKFAVADGDWGRMILLALRTGMRVGELLALRWPNASAKRGRIHVCEAIARGVRGTPKSGRSREIPLSEQAKTALREQRHLRGEQVFCDMDGLTLRWEQCRKPLALACEIANLRPVGWHVLRHTFASHLAMRGVALKAIQELLGHQSIEMTMRYAHLAPEARLAAVQVLDAPVPATSDSSQEAVAVAQTWRKTSADIENGTAPMPATDISVAQTWRKTQSEDK
jgi:integrase